MAPKYIKDPGMVVRHWPFRSRYYWRLLTILRETEAMMHPSAALTSESFRNYQGCPLIDSVSSTQMLRNA